MDEVLGEIWKYFKDQFPYKVDFKSTIDGVNFSYISQVEAESRSPRYVSLGFDVVVAGMNECKSSGPYDFNFLFYKRF